MFRVLVLFALFFGGYCFGSICSDSLLPDQAKFIEYDSSSLDTTDVVVGQLMQHIREKITALPLSDGKKGVLLSRIERALREGVSNAAEWGNQYRPGSTLKVSLRYLPRENGKLGILVANIGDQGEGYNAADVSIRFTGGDPSAHEAERQRRGIRPGGRGIFVMRGSSHSAAYVQSTRTLALHWDLSRAASE